MTAWHNKRALNALLAEVVTMAPGAVLAIEVVVDTGALVAAASATRNPERHGRLTRVRTASHRYDPFPQAGYMATIRVRADGPWVQTNSLISWRPTPKAARRIKTLHKLHTLSFLPPSISHDRIPPARSFLSDLCRLHRGYRRHENCVQVRAASARLDGGMRRV